MDGLFLTYLIWNICSCYFYDFPADIFISGIDTLNASQRVEIQKSNAGIRILTKIASSLDYYAALGINNLIIKI